MGSITFTVVSGTFGTRNKEYTVSDAHLDRLVAAWQSHLTAPENPSPTLNQALLAWATHMMDITKEEVFTKEKHQAASNAVSAVTPIDATDA
jgi:hypothetical protein